MERPLPPPPQLQMPDPAIFEPMAKLNATASAVAEMTQPMAEAVETIQGHLPSPPQGPLMPDPTMLEPMAKVNTATSTMAEMTRPMAEAIEGLPTPPQLPQMPDLTASVLDSLDTVEEQAVASPGMANGEETAVTEVGTFVVEAGEVAAQAIREEHERDRWLEQAQRRRDRWTYGVVAVASGVLGAAATEIARQIAAFLA